ncbi:MAG TPA: YceI family protein [Puia sp.]|jgi:polyisoprenoid-binding protein YceI
MKKITAITAAFLLFAGATFAQDWNWDKAHSQLTFSIVHLGINDIGGSFGSVTAKVTSSKDDFSDAAIELTADVNSINTGNEQRNNHLKSADFFDAAQFGTLTFKSSSFKKVSGKNYKLAGDLTFHGVTKPVVLDVVYNGTVENPQSKKPTAGFQITGNVKRADFGIAPSFPAAFLSDDVKLIANAEVVKG